MPASLPPMSRAVARRFLVLRHLLAPPRGLPPESESVLRVVDRVGSLQFDPLEIAGRNHDLVLLARVRGYRREWTDRWLYDDRVLYETYNKMFSIVPTAELPWYRITWDRGHSRHSGEAFDEHAPLVEELLARIRTEGPLSSTDFESRAAIDWYWRPTNQVRAILEALAEAGILAISRREGNRRVYDLTERLFPEDLLARRPSRRGATPAQVAVALPRGRPPWSDGRIHTLEWHGIRHRAPGVARDPRRGGRRRSRPGRGAQG